MDFILGACVGGTLVLIIVFLQGIISYDRYIEGYVKGIEIGKKIQLLEMESQEKETKEEEIKEEERTNEQTQKG